MWHCVQFWISESYHVNHGILSLCIVFLDFNTSLLLPISSYLYLFFPYSVKFLMNTPLFCVHLENLCFNPFYAVFLLFRITFPIIFSLFLLLVYYMNFTHCPHDSLTAFMWRRGAQSPSCRGGRYQCLLLLLQGPSPACPHVFQKPSSAPSQAPIIQFIFFGSTWRHSLHCCAINCFALCEFKVNLNLLLREYKAF